MLNKVVLMGRLTKDPELKKTPSDVSVVSFTIAVDRNYVKQGEERQTDFINVVAWRSTAEFVAKYFSKGRMLALSGSIQTRTWTDSESKTHYVTEIVADEVYFADSKKEASGTAPTEAPAEGTTPDFEITPDDEDVPF